MKTSTFTTFVLVHNPKKTGLFHHLLAMKKLFILFSFAAPFWSLAQSATILPDGVEVPKVTALPACSNSEKGKQVFNSTDNKMYFCNGSNWQEMTGGGFTLPYSGISNQGATLLYLENTDGRAIYGKSNLATAIKGESKASYGIYGMSESYFGVYGKSTSNSGVYGSSSSGNGGYFDAFGTEPALYVTSAQGKAANFRGDVKIKNELLVDDNKGIVRSNSGTQQKVVRVTEEYTVTTLASGGSADGSLAYEPFGAIPTVTVGQVTNGTGDFFKVLIVPFNVTPTSCQIRIYNASNASVTMKGIVHFLIVGPE